MKSYPNAAESVTIYEIEKLIGDADASAPKDLDLKDTDIRSAIMKAKSTLAGKPPAAAPKDVRGQAILSLGQGIAALGREMIKNGEATTGHFGKCLEHICNSMATRKAMANSSRGYLDFLGPFLQKSALMEE